MFEPAVPISIGPCTFLGLPCRGLHDLSFLPSSTLGTGHSDREVPDHPLVRQTVDDCLHEVMDLDGLIAVLRRIHAGEIRLIARDLPEPSPLAHEILNARPYQFLDDAPLEERRAQAVYTRRAFEPSSADDLGALDPAAIERVREEVRPEVRDADELHDALLTSGFLTGLGVSDRADIDIYISLIGGLIDQQLANDPGGDRWRRLVDRTVDMVADHLGLPPDPPEARPARQE